MKEYNFLANSKRSDELETSLELSQIVSAIADYFQIVRECRTDFTLPMPPVTGIR